MKATENWTLAVESKKKVQKQFSIPFSTEGRSIFPFEVPTALNKLYTIHFFCTHHDMRLQWAFFQNITGFIPCSFLAVP